MNVINQILSSDAIILKKILLNNSNSEQAKEKILLSLNEDTRIQLLKQELPLEIIAMILINTPKSDVMKVRSILSQKQKNDLNSLKLPENLKKKLDEQLKETYEYFGVF